MICIYCHAPMISQPLTCLHVTPASRLRNTPGLPFRDVPTVPIAMMIPGAALVVRIGTERVTGNNCENLCDKCSEQLRA